MPADAPTRRTFLVHGSLALAGATAASQVPQTPNPGAPPVFGTAPAAGPGVSAATFVEAEKLAQVTLSATEQAQAAGNWRNSMAPLLERRVGPRKLPLTDADVPATTWNPMLTPIVAPIETPTLRLAPVTAPLPTDEATIAFSPVTHLSHWMRTKQITSERLTRIYLARLKKYDPQLHCVITLTEEHALKQARSADAEIAAGRYRGPLHGIPYGAKDLLDTAGIATTYGAEPFRDRVPTVNAAVIRRLSDAGAVLVAKLSLGALALNDVWFGGQTRNPWILEEGSSGSSAGPGSAVSAGLVGFAIGSETQGSILSPSMRCGVTGLRPTFGRVPRTGAMTLSWTCDKLGPMARSVEDTMLVLAAIQGHDGGDLASTNASLHFDASTAIGGLRIGYVPAWMNEAPATEVDRAAMKMVEQLGMQLVPVNLPDWPYDSLNVILFAEAAAAFEELTLSHRDRELTMQTADAWPNSFRQARFLSAVDLVQADRLRRRVAVEFGRLMSTIDLLLVPTLRDEPMVITNFTGHPALTFPAGMVDVSEARSDWAPDPAHPLPRFSPPRRAPHGICLIGQMYGEAKLAQAGAALQRATATHVVHPEGFTQA